MSDLPKNWIKFRYNGHKRYVTNWRIAEGRNGRQDYIGFERRKDGKYTNKIKRYNGPECLEVEYGNLDENGNPEPALYSEVAQGTFVEEDSLDEFEYPDEPDYAEPRPSNHLDDLLETYRRQIAQVTEERQRQNVEWTFTSVSNTSSPVIHFGPVYESADEIGDE